VQRQVAKIEAILQQVAQARHQPPITRSR
jgi:hypothetical protein